MEKGKSGAVSVREGRKAYRKMMKEKDMVVPIKEALKALGLVQSRFPRMKEVKKQVRKLQKTCHPDKTDNTDDSDFKELMKNTEIVVKFIQDHPEFVKGEEVEDEGDRHLLQFLRQGEEVKHNNGSCTILLGDTWGNLEELVAATENALGVQKTGDQASYILTTQSLIVEEIDHKNVTVTFWWKPKTDGRSKMLVQGKGYDAFILWKMPEILVEASNRIGTNPLALPPPPSPSKTQQHNVEKDVEEGSVPPNTLLTLVEGFHSMELQLVLLCSKVASLEGQVLDLTTSVPQAVKEEVSKLSADVRKVEEAVKKVKNCNQEPHIQKSLQDAIKVSCQTAETQRETLEAVQKVSQGQDGGKEVSVLEQINSNIQTLVTAVVGGKVPIIAPKAKATSDSEEPRNVPPKKCLVLSSSVGKEIDMKQLTEKLNLEAEQVETKCVLRDENDNQPENNVIEKIKEHMKPEIEIVIIQCGSMEVTKAKTKEGVEGVKAAAEALIKVSEEISRTNGCNVFLSQVPPRYDDPDTGRGDLAKLTEVLNSTTKSGCMFLSKVHTVPQGRLASSGKSLETRYKSDGLHLTEVGSALLTKNIIDTIGKEIPDLVVKEQEPTPLAASTEHDQQSGKTQNRGGSRVRGQEGSGRGSRGGRPPPREEAWRSDYRGDFRQLPPTWGGRGRGGGYNQGW